MTYPSPALKAFGLCAFIAGLTLLSLTYEWKAGLAAFLLMWSLKIDIASTKK